MNHNSTKLKVLIADDSPSAIGWATAALISDPTEYLYDEERSILAGELFEIKTGILPEQIIQIINNGFKPDLAIVDLSFRPVHEIKGKVAGERTDLNEGFNLASSVKQLCPKCVVVIFSANADVPGIRRLAESHGMIIGKDIIMKYSKGNGGENLSADMPEILYKVAETYFTDISLSELKKIKKIIHKGIIERTFFQHQVEFENYTLDISSLLSCCAYAHNGANGKLDIHYDNIEDTIWKLIKFREELEYNFQPNGGLKKERMQQALQDYKELDDYKIIVTRINKKAANFLLELAQEMPDSNKNQRFIFRNAVEEFNCVRSKSIGASINFNPRFQYLFTNMLVCRRIFIGLYELYKARTIKISETQNGVISYGIFCIKGKNDFEPAGEETIFRDELGLHGRFQTPQSIKTEWPFIMREEEKWLKEYIPQLTAKISTQNFIEF